MQFESSNPESCWLLANTLVAMLTQSGLKELPVRGRRPKERVFALPLGDLHVFVFTGLVNDSTATPFSQGLRPISVMVGYAALTDIRDGYLDDVVYRLTSKEGGMVPSRRAILIGKITTIVNKVVAHVKALTLVAALVLRCPRCRKPLHFINRGNYRCVVDCEKKHA